MKTEYKILFKKKNTTVTISLFFFSPKSLPLLPTIPAGCSNLRVSPKKEVTILAAQSLLPENKELKKEGQKKNKKGKRKRRKGR